jgi:hypothetical protein
MDSFSFDLVTGGLDSDDGADGTDVVGGRQPVDVDALARRADLECAALARLVETLRSRIVEAPVSTAHRTRAVELYDTASAQLKDDASRAYLRQRVHEGATRLMIDSGLSDERDYLGLPAQCPPFFSGPMAEGLLALLDARTDGAASLGQSPQDVDAKIAQRLLALSEVEDYCLVRGAACANLYGPVQWLRVFLCHFAPFPADPSFQSLFDDAEAVRGALYAADTNALAAVDPSLPRAVLDAFRTAGTGLVFAQTRAALVQLSARRDVAANGRRPVPAFLQQTRAQLIDLSRRVRACMDATRPAPASVGGMIRQNVDVLLTRLRTHNTVS